MRKAVLKKVLDEIISQSPLEEIVESESVRDKVRATARLTKDDWIDIVRHITLDRFTKIRPEEGQLDMQRLKNEYKNMSENDKRKLAIEIYENTKYMPKYNHLLTQSMYRVLKSISQKTTFDKIRVTGYIDDVLELSKKGRVVLVPTHKDMFDPVFVAYPFLENKQKPPVFHAGANLRGLVNSFLIKRFNALFLKRATKESPISMLDMLVYASEIEQLLESKENMTVYPGATRSEDGKPPPLNTKTRIIDGQKIKIRGMAKGYLSGILRANEKQAEEIYLVPVNVDSALFPDIIKDFYKKLKTGKKPKINTVRRFFKNARMFEILSLKTGIIVNYGEPIRIPKDIKNSTETRRHFTKLIREQFKENTTALPEYIMAYSMNYIIQNDPEYHSLSPVVRKRMMHDLFMNHQFYLKNRSIQIEPEESFEISVKFYQDMGILTKEFFITDKFRNLLEYNSNAIEHFYKKDLPLTKKGLLDTIRQYIFDH